jgi:hypothetical protein
MGRLDRRDTVEDCRDTLAVRSSRPAAWLSGRRMTRRLAAQVWFGAKMLGCCAIRLWPAVTIGQQLCRAALVRIGLRRGRWRYRRFKAPTAPPAGQSCADVIPSVMCAIDSNISKPVSFIIFDPEQFPVICKRKLSLVIPTDGHPRLIVRCCSWDPVCISYILNATESYMTDPWPARPGGAVRRPAGRAWNDGPGLKIGNPPR